jgi:hypothetical protein
MRNNFIVQHQLHTYETVFVQDYLLSDRVEKKGLVAIHLIIATHHQTSNRFGKNVADSQSFFLLRQSLLVRFWRHTHIFCQISRRDVWREDQQEVFCESVDRIYHSFNGFSFVKLRFSSWFNFFLSPVV